MFALAQRTVRARAYCISAFQPVACIQHGIKKVTKPLEAPDERQETMPEPPPHTQKGQWMGPPKTNRVTSTVGAGGRMVCPDRFTAPQAPNLMTHGSISTTPPRAPRLRAPRGQLSGPLNSHSVPHSSLRTTSKPLRSCSPAPSKSLGQRHPVALPGCT